MPSFSSVPSYKASIKTRITTLAVIIVAVATLAITLVAHYIVKQGMKETVGAEQFARLSNIANGIDQKFDSRKTLLKLLAEGLPVDAANRPEQLQQHLAQSSALLDAFDSVAILDRSGDVVANLNGMTKIGKINVRDRPYFTDTILTKKAVISKPLLSRVSHKPTLIMTQPVLDAAGMVAYVIMAGIDLQEPKFLGEFANMSFGKTGYMFILSSDGIVVDHPRKERILQSIEATGSIKTSIDSALAGFEGNNQALNRYGVDGLYSYKRIHSTNWILGAIYPTEEAFAPVNEMLLKALPASLLLSLLAGLIVWWTTRTQLLPLQSLSQHMKAAQTQRTYAPIDMEQRNDEIGELGKAFSQLMQDKENAVARATESELHARNILSCAGDAFVSCDEQGLILEWNQQAEIIFGWTANEARGQKLGTLIAPHSANEQQWEGWKYFPGTGNTPLSNERVLITAASKDGREIPLELMVVEVNSVTKYTANAFMRDISASLLIQKKLADGEKRLRVMTDNLPALISYIDKEQRYRFANAFYQTLLGLDPEEMIGKTILETFGEKNYKYIAGGVEKALQGEHVHFERHQLSNGMLSHLAIDYIPDITPDGTVAGLYVMGLDITDRKMAELQQAQTEERLRTIADHLPAQIAFIDAQERYLFVNSSLAKVAGCAPEEMLGKTMREVRSAELYQFLAPYVALTLSGEKVTFQGQQKWRGKLHHYESTFVPARATDGSISGFYAMTSDITERKRIEAVKNEFISTVSHELRTPLTSVNGALGLVVAGVAGELPPKAKDLLLVARRNVDRLVRLINDILDIEKIESGSMRFHIQPHNLVTLIEQAVDSSRIYAAQYDVNILFHTHEQDALAYVDQDRFTQVIINLLSNAVKFSSEGGSVEVGLAREQDSWRITVTDHGCGIPEEFKDKIFKRFSQMDGSNTRKRGGSGLGLSICKPMIEQMGGTIGFESTIGKGSTFHVLLPTTKASHE